MSSGRPRGPEVVLIRPNGETVVLEDGCRRCGPDEPAAAAEAAPPPQGDRRRRQRPQGEPGRGVWIDLTA